MQTVSLAEKKAYIAKTRRENYYASMRLEGIAVTAQSSFDQTVNPKERRALLLKKYARTIENIESL